ncbi:MAG: D-alanyl-D-alanine carboxypeptidase [Clostridia bacterium]|nr:D-alanyl-D-alanine carboxypeptidase [Clostridia bacterium]
MIKRFIAAILSVFALMPLSAKADNVYGLSLSAQSAVLMEADSKSTVFEKNASQKMPMASTTKIMTALVVLENLSLSHEFKVNEAAVGTEGTSAYLQKGDTLTVEAALYALLLQSANDAANALAYELCGSIEDFAALMNAKASELSLKNTSFKNPSGLPADGHFTTARDLAYLGAVCIENEDFKRIVSTKSADVKINGKDRTFVNHNKLLSLCEGAFGIKTGFTKESGRCLVGACERNGVRFVTVTLDASCDWNDHSKMLQFGFEKYRSYLLYSKDSFIIELPVAGRSTCVSLTSEGEKRVSLPKDSIVTVSVFAPSLLTAPISAGDTVATAVFICDGKVICKTDLKAITEVE